MAVTYSSDRYPSINPRLALDSTKCNESIDLRGESDDISTAFCSKSTQNDAIANIKIRIIMALR
ncbi:MAG: hypothetical protein F6K16_34325 [Symploca sp. SIO2B6]|nr:hypothetical protein [Symploca sp. SIO2B6]